MRTKIVVPMVVLAVGPAVAIGSFMIWCARDSLQESVVRRVEFDTVSKAKAVQEFLSVVQQDVRFLSASKAIRDLVSASSASSAIPFDSLRKEAERDFLFFQRGRSYCQAQCLSAVGEQLIRLDASGEALQVMPLKQLENQSEAFYVKAASTLQSRQVYITPMHLDVVHGMVGAVVSYVTPVSDDDRTRGLLVVGVCAEHILSQIGPLPAGMEAWLLDQDGVYLGYVGESAEKRMRYRLEKRRRLSEDYTQDQIASLRENRNSQASIKTSRTLIFSAPITLQADGSTAAWRLLISYPRAPIEAPVRRLIAVLAVVMAFVAVISGLLGIWITHYLARPVASLRSATHQIAAGDLSKRVDITTGDEIEALAADFNVMTERLNAAQARLAEWNTELERQVMLQTEKVRQLQTGLARADKLASIGQITAGVMHEIGNPLAAIKTKIQVAEESGEIDTDQQKLLAEILVEVDRLTTFLRSFSRLARLRDHPAQSEVSLADVTDSVVKLLAPDLKRRRLTLRCEHDAAVPRIRGDAEQLRHLLMNLVLNAADASPDGGEVVVKIQGGASPPTNGVPLAQARLQVVDRGTGVRPEILEKIWNPFFTTKPEGTGLGLAISKQIVHDHGGCIQLRSEPEEGTEVTVTFPVYSPAMSMGKVAYRRREMITAHPDLRP